MISKKGYRPFLQGLIVLISALFFLPRISAAGVTDVTDISYWSYPDYTRVVISLSDTADFLKKRLSNPDRLYFDIRESRIKKEIKANLPVGNGMLKAIRGGQFDETTVRIVLDLEKVSDFKVISMEDPVRIVIDIYGHTTVSTRKRIV
ncbi:MAG: AMIN domain-containing protein, partial [Nitrospiraceae bacterium]|nr:AMIN domain-containing protein [Nitrospiraceae bacterium]